MKNVKKLVIIGLCIAMLFTMAACNTKPETPAGSDTTNTKKQAETSKSNEADPIYIAVAAPMTGDSAEFGLGFKYTVQAVANDWNKNGGLLGRKIEVLSFDDKQMPEEAANVAQKIVSNDKIVAVIGHHASSCSMAAAPIYEEKDIVEISPSSSHIDYPKIGKNMFRVVPMAKLDAVSQVACAVNHFKSKKIGVFYENNDYSVGSVKNIESEIEKCPDVKLTIKEAVAPGSDDYSASVANFVASGVDTIIISGNYSVACPFVVQIRKALPNINLVGMGSVMTNDAIDIMGEYGEGLVLTVHWADYMKDEESIKFVDGYKAAEPNNKPPISESAMAYDAACVLFQAIKNAGSTDAAKIRDALHSIDYQGICGQIKFAEDGNLIRDSLHFAKIVNGKWESLEKTWN